MNTMASEPKKNRFREPEAVETSVENIKKAIPRSALYKNRWGVRIFERGKLNVKTS